MAAREALRVVQPGDEVAPRRALSITEAADSGSQRDLMVAMRARIALTVEDPQCPPRDLASLSRRLQDINREIESIDAKALQEAREDARAVDEEWDAEAI